MRKTPDQRLIGGDGWRLSRAQHLTFNIINMREREQTCRVDAVTVRITSLLV